MKKNFRNVSMNISEEEYRNSPFHSYSKLSKFVNSGPVALITQDNNDSEYLRFGTLTDNIVTNPESIEDKYFICEIPKVSETIKNIVDDIYNKSKEKLDKISDYSIEYLSDIISSNNYYSNRKLDTNIKSICESGDLYYKFLLNSNGKEIISKSDYDLAVAINTEIRNNPFTKHIFYESDNNEVFYQLKFFTNIHGANSRCMVDIINIDHKNKTISIYDLKTTSKSEESFNESFNKYNYWIQCILYTEILKQVVLENPDFCEYTVIPLKFLVINKNSLSPIIWSIENFDTLEDECMNNMGFNVKSLLIDVDWHYNSGFFRYNRKTFANNGVKHLSILK